MALERLYARLLDARLAAPMVVITGALLFAGAAVVAYPLLPNQLTPNEDRGFIPISIRAPQGATVDYTAEQVQRAEAIVQEFRDRGEIVNVFATAQGFGGGGFMFVTLAPWDERTRTQQEITADLNRTPPGDPRHLGHRLHRQQPRHPRRRPGPAVRGDRAGLRPDRGGRDRAAQGDAGRPGLRHRPPQLRHHPAAALDPDRPRPRRRCRRSGPEHLGRRSRRCSRARDLGTFNIGDERIEIRAMAPEGMIQDPAGLDRIQLRTESGRMVPLSSLVSFEEVAVAPNLQRQDQRRAVPMSATLGPETDLREAMDRVTEIAADVLPPGMGIIFTGEAKELDAASSGVVQTFAFALLVVLLVLAAQFESFVSAVILIATVPFGLAAAVFAMVLTGGSLNIYSQIGLILLVGLMAKNGILIVEFANQLRDQGQSVREAIRNASIIRLRPVVMTMIATILGGLPLILTGGAGSEARQALGWVVVGGLALATFATLFVTPVVFDLLARFSRPRAAEEQRLARELDEAGGPRGMQPTAEELGEVAPAHVCRRSEGDVGRCHIRHCVLRGSRFALAPSVRAEGRLSHQGARTPGAGDLENTNLLILRCSIAQRSSLEGRSHAGPGLLFTSARAAPSRQVDVRATP